MSKSNQSSQFYGTSDAAHAIGCSESALRAYEKRGLITPERTKSGRRIFVDADLDVIRKYRSK